MVNIVYYYFLAQPYLGEKKCFRFLSEDTLMEVVSCLSV